jgi:hypothetical protein
LFHLVAEKLRIDSMTDSYSTSPPITLFLVDLECLQCGRLAGTFKSRNWPSRGTVEFHPAGQRHSVAVTNWSQLRCDVCGGNVYADEVKTTRLYPQLSRDDLDLPRRGRPPAWLVAQRRAGYDGQG